jgi:hypothetical protein
VLYSRISFPPPQSPALRRCPPLSPDIPKPPDRAFPKTPISAKLLLTARANRVRQGQAGRSRLVLKRTAPSGSGESRDELGEPRGNRLAVSSRRNARWRTEGGTGERFERPPAIRRAMMEGTFSNGGEQPSSSGSGQEYRAPSGCTVGLASDLTGRCRLGKPKRRLSVVCGSPNPGRPIFATARCRRRA